MRTHEFTLIARGLDPEAVDFEDVLFAAGCDDATVAFQRGALVLEFARTAKSFALALASAVRDVGRTGATVERVEPDPLVSLSEIAERAGLSRAAISHYALGHRGEGFPAPVARVTTESPLWDWAEVAHWMRWVGKAKVDDTAVLQARLVKACNDTLTAAKRRRPGPSSRRTASRKKTRAAA